MGDMVLVQNEDVLCLASLYQRRAQQQFIGKIKAMLGLLRDDLLNPLLAFSSMRVSQVDLTKRKRPVSRHALKGLAFDRYECGPQRLVAGNDFIQGLLECASIDRTLDFPGKWNVVRNTSISEL